MPLEMLHPTQLATLQPMPQQTLALRATVPPTALHARPATAPISRATSATAAAAALKNTE
jgi:hypothetical protein